MAVAARLFAIANALEGMDRANAARLAGMDLTIGAALIGHPYIGRFPTRTESAAEDPFL